MISSSLQSLRRYAGCVWEKEGSCWRGKPAWSEWEDMYEVGRRMNANKNRAHGAPNAADVPQEVLLCLVERSKEPGTRVRKRACQQRHDGAHVLPVRSILRVLLKPQRE